jgi:hypothetical protein
MLIKYHIGDATRPISRPAVIAHVCNNLGAWGSGFVMAVSRRWKGPERAYNEMPEYPLGFTQIIPVESDIWVANIVGQVDLRVRPDGTPPVDYVAITNGLRVVSDFCRAKKAELHIPRIGCARAGGTWDKIVPCLRNGCGELTINVYDLASEAQHYAPWGYPTN